MGVVDVSGARLGLVLCSFRQPHAPLSSGTGRNW
ncbi:hypothetical protein ACP4OV_028049 [Aristida adscensionis]